MKIWVIGRGYPTVRNNMLGSFELEQAKMLARAGAEVFYPVVILSTRKWRQTGFVWETEEGVTVAKLTLPIGLFLRNDNRLRNVYPRIMRMLEKKLAETFGMPDVIHVHYPSLFSYSIVAALQQQGVKIVSTEHYTAVQNKTIDAFQLQNLKDFSARGDAICCVGQNLKRSILELTGMEQEIHIVPNVINRAFEYRDQKHDTYRFLCSGRLVPVKQFDQVVNAFLNVFSGNPSVTLTVAGNGTEFEKIHSLINSRHAEDQVTMTGALTRDQMADLTASSDAMVVFSRLETFCVPVIEAWACGKPVIATKTTVLNDNPDGRLGIMVDCDDPHTLEDALMRIYQERDRYDPTWIKQYAEDHFSERAVCDALFSIYNACIHHREEDEINAVHDKKG